MRDAAIILLVEDDQSLLSGIADLLEVADLGYDVQVLTASSGRAGLEIMARHLPDLIVSDIMMPQMDGYQFLHQVRQNLDWIHVPFIFLTARGEKKDIQEGLLSGAELYITKPFHNNELLELVKSQLDRTFQLQLARQHKLNKLKQGILKLLNHEFRTPLTYVTAYYEMLATSLAAEPGQNLQEYLRGIQTGSVRLSRLIEDLIKVLEIRTGEASATYGQRARPLHNPAELLEAATDTYRREAEAKGIALRLTVADDLPPIFGDAECLCDVFKRLIDNAIKFTQSKGSQGGEVHVSASASNHEVYFSVKDNGIGFPRHVQSLIFDPLFQYDRDQLEQQGSGSGLAISKGYVEMHNGRIEVESEEGVGSRFTVALPIYVDDNRSVGLPLAEGKVKKKATILIVEDDWYLLDGLRELLDIFEGDYIFEVLSAMNGRQGLDLLAKHQPDLIVSDIMMPQMDGYEFLEHVRRNPACLQIPFIFLTARGEKHDIHRGRLSGVEQYITKPYDSDELLELIVTQLNRHFQVQHVFNQNFEELKRSILNLLQPDFRLPLDSVTGYTQKLGEELEGAQTDEDLKESLRGLQASSSRLTQLVEDFITLVEVKTGEIVMAYRLRAQPLDFSILLREAIAKSQHEIESAGVKVHDDLDKYLPLVKGDEESLLKALQRLVSVALRLCQRSHDSNLHLSTAQDDNEVVLRVCCAGVALTNDEAGKVSTLFQNNDQSILESPDLGPGLTILKGMVDLHNGRVMLENNPGQDCTFTIILPVFQSEKESV